MSDVFVSYARADEAHADRVAAALSAAGYPVWRDDQLPAHRAYADVIQERLKSAAAVVVLWSAESAKSQWVRAEADAARSSGTLVQATIDGSIPPLPFNQIQCADLRDWTGGTDQPGWRKLVDSVRSLAGGPVEKEQPPARRGRGSRRTTICVLPFENMSGDAEQEYFSDGISEDITTDLSKISAIGVVARNTAFTFKGRSVNLCDLAQELGASHILEGSVRKAGGRVRINAQLIDGVSGEHIWAERFDRDLEDIFAIQDEISSAIVKALKVKLLPSEREALERRGTTDVEAYKLYLLARQYWTSGNHGDMRREQRVMRICARAVEIDPYYAHAWALLANAQSNLRYIFCCQVDDGFAAAHTALAIDRGIAEAHLPMIRRLEERGRHDEADAALNEAIRLGPDSWEVNKEAGRTALTRRDLGTATRHYEKAVEVMETDFHAWGMLSTCYHALGDTENVRRAAEMMVSEAEKAVQQDPSNGAALGILAGGHALLGAEETAREWMERAVLIDPDNLLMRYNFACVLAGHLGDREGALTMLEPMLEAATEYHVRVAQTDPDLEVLRDMPRFRHMVDRARKRLGLAEPAAVAAAAVAS
jgi:adenylate cyclase